MIQNSDIEQKILDAINAGDFPKRFFVWLGETGARNILQEEGDILKHVRLDLVSAEILSYAKSIPPSKCLALAKVWKHSAPLITGVASVRFKDEPGLTLSRMPWAFHSLGLSPSFEELLKFCEENRYQLSMRNQIKTTIYLANCMEKLGWNSSKVSGFETWYKAQKTI